MTDHTCVLVSVIIVTYNSASTIIECLDAVAEELSGVSHEILLVDNASVDSTIAHIAICKHDVRLIRSMSNQGFSRANNVALEQASGEFVLFLNPDTIISQGCVRVLIDWLNKAPNYVAAGPRMVTSAGTPSRACARRLPTVPNLTWQLLFLERFFPRSPVFARRYYQPWDLDTDRDVECVSGAAVMVRNSALKVVGNFDEEVPLFLDDMDLCKRLGTHGRIRYLAGARVLHVQNVSGQSVPQSLIRQLSLQANYVYLRKHGFRLSERAFSVLVGVSALLGEMAAAVCGWTGRRDVAARLRERASVYLTWAVSKKDKRLSLPT